MRTGPREAPGDSVPAPALPAADETQSGLRVGDYCSCTDAYLDRFLSCGGPLTPQTYAVVFEHNLGTNTFKVSPCPSRVPPYRSHSRCSCSPPVGGLPLPLHSIYFSVTEWPPTPQCIGIPTCPD